MRACRLVAACMGLAGAELGLATAAEVPPVAVEALGPVLPANAPGQALYLVRYRIAPGTRLPLHHHEGTQIGLVEAGVLTYHVESGEVPVYAVGGVRSGTDGAGRRDGRDHAGPMGGRGAGDHHWGANEGGEPLVIVTSALLRAGAPLATRDEP